MRIRKNIIARLISAVLVFSGLTGLISCEEFKVQQPSVDPNTTWSYQSDIQPIFTNNCVSCHAGTRPPDLREGKSWQSLKNGNYVDLPSESSRLYSTMNGSSHIARSTETDRLKVLYWITQGAQNN